MELPARRTRGRAPACWNSEARDGEELSSGSSAWLLVHLVGEVYYTDVLIGFVSTDGDPGNPIVGIENILPVIPTGNPIVHKEPDDQCARVKRAIRDALSCGCPRRTVSVYPIYRAATVRPGMSRQPLGSEVFGVIPRGEGERS